MELGHQRAIGNAREYFGTAGPLTRLGWGISGHVYLSPDLRTAVKIHRHGESFERELEAYRKLRRLGINKLHGLTVPRLRGDRCTLLAIEMDFVNAPYLLDFAGATFTRPDYDAERMTAWQAGVVSAYGPNSHIAFGVYGTLAPKGIYYMDIRPSNLNLTGLPDLEPFDPSEDDDVF